MLVTCRIKSAKRSQPEDFEPSQLLISVKVPKTSGKNKDINPEDTIKAEINSANLGKWDNCSPALQTHPDSTWANILNKFLMKNLIDIFQEGIPLCGEGSEPHPFYQSTLFVYKIKHYTLLTTSNFNNLWAYNGACYDI